MVTDERAAIAADLDSALAGAAPVATMQREPATRLVLLRLVLLLRGLDVRVATEEVPRVVAPLDLGEALVFVPTVGGLDEILLLDHGVDVGPATDHVGTQ